VVNSLGLPGMQPPFAMISIVREPTTISLSLCGLRQTLTNIFDHSWTKVLGSEPL
jgi:hypothetical protein